MEGAWGVSVSCEAEKPFEGPSGTVLGHPGLGCFLYNLLYWCPRVASQKTTTENVCGSLQTLPWLPLKFLLLWGPGSGRLHSSKTSYALRFQFHIVFL